VPGAAFAASNAVPSSPSALLAAEQAQRRAAIEAARDQALPRHVDPADQERLLTQLRQAVSQVFEELSDQQRPGSGDNALSLGETSLGVQYLCGALERMLNHGLATSQFGVFRRCTFWQYIDSTLELSSFIKHPRPLVLSAVDPHVLAGDFWQAVHDTRRLREPKSSAGRGRAWLRYTLQRGQVSAFLLLLGADAELLRLWYDEGALMRSEDALCAAATVVSAVQAFDFGSLQPSSPLLDLNNPFAQPTEEASTPS